MHFAVSQLMVFKCCKVTGYYINDSDETCTESKSDVYRPACSSMSKPPR